MSLINLLKAKGIRVYESTPLWVAPERLTEVHTGPDCVVIPSEMYPDTNQLVCKEGSGTVYIQLKQGVDPTKSVYTINMYTAARDWDKYNIVAGMVKAFAE